MRRQFGLHEAALLTMLIALMVWAAIADPKFVEPHVQLELSRHVWELAILALPMALVILTAGIDLSVGSALALSAVSLGMLHHNGAPISVAILGALLTGLVCGALNGLFVSRWNIHPLIVTLATLAAFRGIAEGVSRGESFSDFPEGFSTIGQGDWLDFPITGWIFLLLLGITTVLLTKSKFGRTLKMIGLNELATTFSAIPVGRIKWMAYTFAGLSAGIASVLLVSRLNTAKADLGDGIELEVIAAVVLGGVSIYGGKATVPGVVLGILLIHELREFVTWHWQMSEVNLLMIGGMLILSVLLQRLFARGSRADSDPI